MDLTKFPLTLTLSLTFNLTNIHKSIHIWHVVRHLRLRHICLPSWIYTKNPLWQVTTTFLPFFVIPINVGDVECFSSILFHNQCFHLCSYWCSTSLVSSHLFFVLAFALTSVLQTQSHHAYSCCFCFCHWFTSSISSLSIS